MKTKNLLMSISMSLVLICAGFFGSTEAQYYGYNGYSSQSQILEHINRVDNILNNLPFVAQGIGPLLIFNPTSSLQHAAADENIFYTFPHETIVNFLNDSSTFDEFYQKVRISVIRFLMDTQYPHFNNKPYTHSGNNVMIIQSGNFSMLHNIKQEDNLDVLLMQKLSLFQGDFDQIKKFSIYLDFKSLDITTQEYQNLGTLFLFKNEQDLQDLGYELVSRRSRINNDAAYRRFNIKTAFNNIGNVRLIMPNEIFSVTREYSAYETAPFVAGYAIFGNALRLVYGGGICGVSTAFYQGVLTNSALEIRELKAHSIYYKTLFNAEINGSSVSTPGLDATLYMMTSDLKLQNIRDYPVIVVLNFDGTTGGNEDMFTLSRSQDKGSFNYIGSYVSSAGKYCYQRKVNGQIRTHCYKQVK